MIPMKTGLINRNLFTTLLLLVLKINGLCQYQYPVEYRGSSQLFTEGKLNIMDLHKAHASEHSVPSMIRVALNALPEVKQTQPGLYPPAFVLPVRPADGLEDPGFYSITAHVDHDTAYPGHLLDFACGDLTYDLDDGFNHTGTDFFPWPFPWKKMEHDEVEVVAAAAGVIIYKNDGNFDKSCGENNDPWNAISLLHSGGITTWYGHMKKESLTGKAPGDFVEAGEYLGIVGSSGVSLAPHLHFEVYDSAFNLIDPFEGDCNPTISGSWWEDQIPYKDAGINRISANHALPLFPDCPQAEVPNESDQFVMGDTIFLLSYFRNLSQNDQVGITIYSPGGSVWDDWSWSSPWDFYAATWLYFFIILQDEPEGNWIYELAYKDQVRQHVFSVYESPGIHAEHNSSGFNVYPNPATGTFTLEWDDNMHSGEIEIVDLYGRRKFLTTFDDGETSRKMDATGLEKGVYLIRMRGQAVTGSKKIFIY